MNYSLLTYDFKDHFNLGDYIQSLAAKQFLPHVDCYTNRERLDDYAGPEAKVIMNGWFMRHTEHWPPSSKIIPLFTSFHLNSKRAEKMLDENGIDYLKRHEPIGCRDNTTLALLKAKGIDAYLSSCLTLTLGGSYHHCLGEGIYFVDVLFKYPTWKSVFKSFNSFQKSVGNGNLLLLGKRKKLLRKIFGDTIIQQAKEITHHYSSEAFPTEESRFELADNILKQYEKAKLVVTSRIHCALPCLAMGTPVVFVEGGFENPSSQCRLDGISDLFNRIKIFPQGNYAADFDLNKLRKLGEIENKACHLKYVENLNRCCKNFIDDKETRM